MFRCFVQKVEQVEHPSLLPDKHEEYYVPLSDWKVERATKKLKAEEGPYTAGEGAIARFSDTLPFFIVCRYFRRIYRLPRTLDTLNTLFFQSTRTEKFFPIYIHIFIFSLARISSKKGVSSVSDGCTPR